MQDKANYDTASLGETSADELALKSSGEESGIDILKPNKISESFDSEQRLAADVASYEKQIIDKYHNLDVYRAKGKHRSKISFNDLSLSENLNYIKHNLKNTD